MAPDPLRLLQGGLCAATLLALHTSALSAQPLAFAVAPGKFDEHCLKLASGEAIRWRFVSTGAVDFNIHHHRGEQVFYPVRRHRVERASGNFRARAADDYCLMWTNRGAGAVDVSASVERGQ